MINIQPWQRVNVHVGGVGESQIIAAWICLQYLMHVCLLERILDHTESTNHISKSAKDPFSSSDDLIQNDLIKIGTMTSRLHARQVAPLKDRWRAQQREALLWLPKETLQV